MNSLLKTGHVYTNGHVTFRLKERDKDRERRCQQIAWRVEYIDGQTGSWLEYTITKNCKRVSIKKGHTMGDHTNDAFNEAQSYANTLIDGINTSITETEEKVTMSYKPFERKELVLIKGQDASNLSDDQIFEVIQVIEAEIRGRAGVAGTSKKQKAKIEELETAVSNIIDYVDNRDTE